ncbi:MAG: ferrous iron transport protein A [Butyricicoccus sp.]|nr:ferrous iron transport protein A [Butyricicoccus sp.]MBQ8585694.1 ferrous iron transport protein A [Butyricicoccus sp.]
MGKTICLHELAPGERARVRALRMSGRMRRRLLDLGLVENTEVLCVGRSPLGDPSAYAIRGAVIAIRAADGANILLEGGEWG